MRRFLLYLFVILFFAATTNVSAQKSDPNNAITFGFKVNQKSEILGENYAIHISLPSRYEADKNTSRYPVVFLLDGEDYLGFTSEAVKLLSQRNGNGASRIPECIVVGLTTNNRERDFTPPPAGKWLPPANPGFDVSKIKWGGADKYLDHLEKEVMPYITANYRTQPYHIFIGHSLGGLLQLHTMVARPRLFQCYIIGEPSVWWNDGATMRNFMNYLKEHPDYKGRLAVFKGFVPRAVMFPINIEFYDFMASSKPAGMLFKPIVLENERHGTVVYPGVYMGLRDLFNDYGYQFNINTTVDAAMAHYDSLSAMLNYEIELREDLFSAIHEHCGYQDKTQEDLKACKEWVLRYPKSARAWQAAGTVYLTAGNQKEAAAHLQRALELDPGNEELRKKLDGIEK